MKDRVRELVLIFNQISPLLPNDIIQEVIQLILILEPHEIFMRAIKYNRERIYNIEYLNINKYDILKTKFPLIRNINKKLSRDFLVHIEKLALVNFNLKQVLKRFNKPRDGVFIIIMANRYKLAFINSKKFKMYRGANSDPNTIKYSLIADTINNFESVLRIDYHLP